MSTITPRGGPTRDPSQQPDTGAGRLRLVRLRLALALIAAAILPLAILAPVVRIVGDDTGASEQNRVEADARALANAVSVELEATRRVLVPILGSAAAVLDGAQGADPGVFGRELAGLLASETFVVAAELVTPDGSSISTATIEGAVPAEGVPLALLQSGARAGSGVVVADGSGGGPRDIATLLLPVRVVDHFVGAIHLDVSLGGLLAVATGGRQSVGRTIRIVDGPGAEARFTADGSVALGSQPVGQAGFLLGAQGFERWSIDITEPVAASSISPAALAALVLASLALVALVVWMARQVLRPAAELEASRHRLHQLYEVEREASLLDQLTGLGNHRAFQEELSRRFDESNRYHVPVALLTIDLDEFKQVNDALGHAVGDDLLAEVGRIVQATVRTADRAFRTGGDEFAIVLPHTDADGAWDLGRRLLRRMLDERSTGRYRRPISFSAGVAAAPLHATDRTQLLIRADSALYRSKRDGRTVVTVFDASVDQPALDAFALTELSDLVRRVAADKAMTPAYQPIVNLETGRPIGYEGLVRPNAGSGFASPAALFSAAEVTGRTVELDRACLEVVVAGARDLPEDVLISLNISPRSFEAKEFSAAAFLSVLKRHGVAPARVILELTERDVIQDLDRLRSALAECRAAGVRIAADDVGAGNAGLRLLSQIQFDVMKIDLSLVQSGDGKEPVLSLLQSLVDLAGRWRALVVAEGVETPDQLRMIQALGIPAAQGYLLGRPGSLRHLETFDVGALASDRSWWASRMPSPAAVH